MLTQPTSTRFSRTITCCLSAATGLLLFLSDYPVHGFWLQAVALMPWLLALLRFCPGKPTALVAGVCLGLCYTLPLLVFLQFPLVMGLALALYQALLWGVLSLLVRAARLFPPVAGALSAGSAAVLVGYVDFSLVPVWGTAQSFTRVWSAWPWSIQFVSLTGMLGLVFLLVASQALVVHLLFAGRRRRLVVALILILLSPAIYNTVRFLQRPLGEIKVAVMGWTWEFPDNPGEKDADGLLRTRFEPWLQRAARDGARLLVSPEIGFVPDPDRWDEWRSQLCSLARENRVTLAVGAFYRRSNDNRLLLVGPDGSELGEYRKTHLIPWFETYQAGDGTLLTREVDAGMAETVRLGGMICQDDNFTDLSRGYGRSQVQLVTVPTNDWEQVKDYHLENAVFRAVESGYAIVRAASNGISAIVTARGEIVGRMDHFTEGPGLMVASVPLYSGGSPYSRGGDWPVLLFSLAIPIVGWLSGRWKRHNVPG